ncbi:NUDIX hydrolase [Nocardioides bruguierae]|uniref:NUDIX hydrolase n=1 Tax=Nocardioides bruguierae TaxID=2945102 RepID=A0A9X2IF75_9ACTN|nr:NUDIX hydrolase [Nocardioides bruguierae]MCM0621561.1 NUDIX hydrolase [Nocardioides bruguierae]
MELSPPLSGAEVAATQASTAETTAAGCVVLRKGGDVLLVHRPKYDDWSFPKGKVDPGEHPVATAVREVEEETGLTVHLGARLADQTYPVAAGRKRVHYWHARVAGDDSDAGVAGYHRGNEIDRVRWVPRREAVGLLTYERDRRLLVTAIPSRKRTTPVVVLRHGVATARSEWRRDDRVRPLSDVGLTQARGLAPLLAAYGIERVLSSTSTRCLQTVAPYAQGLGLAVARTGELSEEGGTAQGVRDLAANAASEASGRRRPTLICSHRPVLPWVLEGMGLESVRLDPGEMLVAHLRGDDVRDVELHRLHG